VALVVALVMLCSCCNLLMVDGGLQVSSSSWPPEPLSPYDVLNFDVVAGGKELESSEAEFEVR
jgi:hypothetical protein